MSSSDSDHIDTTARALEAALARIGDLHVLPEEVDAGTDDANADEHEQDQDADDDPDPRAFLAAPRSLIPDP